MGALPDYDTQLSAFHETFAAELQQIIDQLPLRPDMRVLDLACGDGFYTQRIAGRLSPGFVTGADLSGAYLAKAKLQSPGGRFVVAEFDHLPFAEGTFDLVWCAQSLFSLPDPLVALGHMARVLRPGGVVAVLENDTLHQVLLPWPHHSSSRFEPRSSARSRKRAGPPVAITSAVGSLRCWRRRGCSPCE